MVKKCFVLASFVLFSVSVKAQSNNATLSVDDTKVSSASVSLSSLNSDTTYNITCSLLSNNQTTVLLEPHLLGSSYYSFYDKNNMSNMQIGENEISFSLQHGQSSKYNSFALTDLNGFPLQIKHCLASVAVPQKSLVAKNDDVSRDYFRFYNDTDRDIVIGVGNFFPGWYTHDIVSHGFHYIYVTTNNQNIHLKQIK